MVPPPMFGAAANRHPTLEELINQLVELRPLSAVATRTLELTEGDRFSAQELATVIASDQALTAKVLRLANSAYYGFPRRITTARDAVVLLGFRAVRSATLATCLVDAHPGSNHLDYHTFWHHSVTVAMLAEVLARADAVHESEAFTAGVLHRIGLLALDQQAPGALAACLLHQQRSGSTLARAERAVLGFTDTEVGAALALHWNFPTSLVEAIAGADLDADRLPDPHSLGAMVLRARHFARSYGIPDGVSVPPAEPATADWTAPSVVRQMQRLGGMPGLLERVDAFLDAAVSA